MVKFTGEMAMVVEEPQVFVQAWEMDPVATAAPFKASFVLEFDVEEDLVKITRIWLKTGRRLNTNLSQHGETFKPEYISPQVPNEDDSRLPQVFSAIFETTTRRLQTPQLGIEYVILVPADAKTTKLTPLAFASKLEAKFTKRLVHAIETAVAEAAESNETSSVFGPGLFGSIEIVVSSLTAPVPAQEMVIVNPDGSVVTTSTNKASPSSSIDNDSTVITAGLVLLACVAILCTLLVCCCCFSATWRDFFRSKTPKGVKKELGDPSPLETSISTSSSVSVNVHQDCASSSTESRSHKGNTHVILNIVATEPEEEVFVEPCSCGSENIEDHSNRRCFSKIRVGSCGEEPLVDTCFPSDQTCQIKAPSIWCIWCTPEQPQCIPPDQWDAVVCDVPDTDEHVEIWEASLPMSRL